MKEEVGMRVVGVRERCVVKSRGDLEALIYVSGGGAGNDAGW